VAVQYSGKNRVQGSPPQVRASAGAPLPRAHSPGIRSACDRAPNRGALPDPSIRRVPEGWPWPKHKTSHSIPVQRALQGQKPCREPEPEVELLNRKGRRLSTPQLLLLRLWLWLRLWLLLAPEGTPCPRGLQRASWRGPSGKASGGWASASPAVGRAKAGAWAVRADRPLTVLVPAAAVLAVFACPGSPASQPRCVGRICRRPRQPQPLPGCAEPELVPRQYLPLLQLFPELLLLLLLLLLLPLLLGMVQAPKQLAA